MSSWSRQILGGLGTPVVVVVVVFASPPRLGQDQLFFCASVMLSWTKRQFPPRLHPSRRRKYAHGSFSVELPGPFFWSPGPATSLSPRSPCSCGCLSESLPAADSHPHRLLGPGSDAERAWAISRSMTRFLSFGGSTVNRFGYRFAVTVKEYVALVLVALNKKMKYLRMLAVLRRHPSAASGRQTQESGGNAYVATAVFPYGEPYLPMLRNGPGCIYPTTYKWSRVIR